MFGLLLTDSEPEMGAVLRVVGLFVYAVGCAKYAERKGYTTWLGLVGLTCIGLFVMGALPYKRSTATAPPTPTPGVTKALAAPAGVIRILAILDFVVAIFAALTLMALSMSGGLQRGEAQLFFVVSVLILYCGMVRWNCGAFMRELRRHKYCKNAAIMTIIPIHPLWMIYTPVGIWVLVTLLKQDIKSAFEQPSAPPVVGNAATITT